MGKRLSLPTMGCKRMFASHQRLVAGEVRWPGAVSQVSETVSSSYLSRSGGTTMAATTTAGSGRRFPPGAGRGHSRTTVPGPKLIVDSTTNEPPPTKEQDMREQLTYVADDARLDSGP